MTEWRELAACRGVDPDVFFPAQGEFYTAAKYYCDRCEVRTDCLDYAVNNGETEGIWGGLPPKQRRKIKRRERVLACEFCGDVFSATNSTHKYCSATCRAAGRADYMLRYREGLAS